MRKPPFLRVTWAAVSAFPPAHGPGNTSLEQERREVLDSVLDALAGNPPDPDEMAACSYLLKHLSHTAGRPGPPGA